LGQNTIVIVPTKITGAMLFTALNDYTTASQIEEVVTGSTQKTVSLANIRSLKFILPRILASNSILEFTKLIESNFELGSKVNSEIDLLKELKELVLAKMTKVEETLERV
jgi:restriction endonuclease S subunit